MHSIEPMRALHNDHLAASTASIDACMQRRYTISSTFQCMPTAAHQNSGEAAYCIQDELHPMLHPVLVAFSPYHALPFRHMHLQCTAHSNKQRAAVNRNRKLAHCTSDDPNVITRKQPLFSAINTPKPIPVYIFHLCDDCMARKTQFIFDAVAGQIRP